MSAWVVVGGTALVPPGHAHAVDVGGHRIAVFNVNGTLCATDDECTHGFASLSEGRLDGECVACPLHGGCFNVVTGEATEMPADEPLRTYRVRIAGESIEVDVDGTSGST